MVTRRDALLTTAAAAGGAALLSPNRAQAQLSVSGDRAWEASYSGKKQAASLPPAQPGKDYQPVVTPNSVALPWKLVDGVKMFTLLKVRDGLTSHADPGWYKSAPNEVANLASRADIERDGIAT